MIEFDKCTNCGTSHTFGKGKGCEVLSPRCSVHPDAKIRKMHNEEGFFLGYECLDCVKDMGEHNKALADELCANAITPVRYVHCPYHPTETLKYIIDGSGEEIPRCDLCDLDSAWDLT